MNERDLKKQDENTKKYFLEITKGQRELETQYTYGEKVQIFRLGKNKMAGSWHKDFYMRKKIGTDAFMQKKIEEGSERTKNFLKRVFLLERGVSGDPSRSCEGNFTSKGIEEVCKMDTVLAFKINNKSNSVYNNLNHEIKQFKSWLIFSSSYYNISSTCINLYLHLTV